jgi:putative transposase
LARVRTADDRYRLRLVRIARREIAPAQNWNAKVAVSDLVNSLKGVSSRMIRQKKYPSIRKKLWGGALWSPSYFAGSCGGAPISINRQYIEQQQTPS